METASLIEQSNKVLLDKAGKYLTFALANEEYGLEILKVREIIGYMDITAVPQTPSYVEGVINLRGQVIPVIALRAKFGMESTEVTEETCIIVVETTQDDRKFNTGIVVDHVSEVLDIAGEDIEEAPTFGSSVNTDFILGMGKIGDDVKILLDIDAVLASIDLNASGHTGEVQTQQRKDAESAQTQQQQPQAEGQEQPQDHHTEPEQTQQEQSQDKDAGDNPEQENNTA